MPKTEKKSKKFSIEKWKSKKRQREEEEDEEEVESPPISAGQLFENESDDAGSSISDDSVEDEGSEEEDDEAEDDVEEASKKLERRKAKNAKLAEAEEAELNLQHEHPSLAPFSSDQADLAIVRQRIRDVVSVLEDFGRKAEKGR